MNSLNIKNRLIMKTSFKIFVTIFRLKVNYLFLKLFSRHVNICGHFSLERIKINNKGGGGM